MGRRSVHDRRWWILATMVISMLVVVLDNTILNVALKTIQKDLHTTQGQLEWAVNSYSLVFAGLLFTYGVLGDRYGRKRALILGLAVFGGASALSAFAPSPGWLIAGRALMGVGGAAVLPSTLSIISNVFDPAERGRAIAIWAGATGIAVAVGPITGGALLAHFWWGSVFLVNVPVVIAGIAGIVWLVPESRDPAPPRLDPVGVLLSIVGLVGVVYGIIQGGETTRWGSYGVLVPLLGGLAVIAAFVLFERRSSHPALDVTLFRNPAFSAASVATALAFFALFGATFYLSFYLQYARGYSPLQAGICLVPVALGLMVFAPRSARLVQRFGAKRVCAGGLSLVVVSFAGYLFVDAGTNIWVVEALLLLQGTGMANVTAPATEAIMATLPRERAGSGSAVNNTVRQVGGALGVAVLGSVLSASYRSHVSPAVQQLPGAARSAASESIGGLQEVAGHLPAGARGPLLSAGRDAFISAMHVTAAGSALVALIGVVVVLVWLPSGSAPVVRQHSPRREPVAA